MARLMLIFAAVFMAAASAILVRPDPWAYATERAQADAERLVDLAATPDKISWWLTTDSASTRVVLWADNGVRRYPPQGGMVPLPYELSDEAARRLALIQRGSATYTWRLYAGDESKLLHCREKPAACLIYDRAALEQALDLRAGALAVGAETRTLAWLLGLLSFVLAAAALWSSRRAKALAPDFEIIPERHIAIRDALEVPLTPRDLKLLSTLKGREGAVVTKDELYDAGWGRDYMPNSRSLDQHIINLRRKLDPDKSRAVLIETVHGVGYRLVG